MQELPSRAWSCQTLQRGLNLVETLPMSLGSCREPDVAAMEAELAALEAPKFGYPKAFQPIYHQRFGDKLQQVVWEVWIILGGVWKNVCIKYVVIFEVRSSNPIMFTTNSTASPRIVRNSGHLIIPDTARVKD